MAIARLGKCTWGRAEVAAVLKGVFNPSAAPRARDELAQALAALGYDGSLHFTSQASVGLALTLEEMRSKRPAKNVIVVPAYCCPSVPETVRALGLTLRAAPVLPNLNIDLDALEPLLKPDVLAVVGVHMYGLPLDMTRLGAMARAADAYVIDDAAHVVGLAGTKPQLGTMGDVGLLSFHHSKTLTGGSPNGGGAVIVSNPDLAGIATRVDRLPEGRSRLGYYTWFGLRYALEITPRALPEYLGPRLHDVVYDLCGVGGKKPERMSAAASFAVTAQLRRLVDIWRGRETVAAHYRDILANEPTLKLAPLGLSRMLVCWDTPTDTGAIRERMTEAGFMTRLPYPMWTDASDPTAASVRRITTTHLELPGAPESRREDLARVVRALLPMLKNEAAPS